MPSLQLPHLTRLCVDASSCGSTTAGLFMAKLQAPLLRKLEIVMPKCYDDDIRILDFFPRDNYPALKDLICRMIEKDGRGPLISLPFEKLPGLRSLTVDAPNLVHFIPRGAFEPPSTLRTIKLNSVAHGWLSNLRWAFVRDVWKGLEVLEIGGKIPSSTMNEIDEAHVNRRF